MVIRKFYVSSILYFVQENKVQYNYYVRRYWTQQQKKFTSKFLAEKEAAEYTKLTLK